MLDGWKTSRAADRTWWPGYAAPHDAAQHGRAWRGRAWVLRSSLTVLALCVAVFTGTESHAEAWEATASSGAKPVTTPAEASAPGRATGCDIRVERWKDSCIEETRRPEEKPLDREPEMVVEFDRVSPASRQRDKDHLVYQSSKAFGPQFSLVVVEPRTRAFNLGLHLRFEYAF